MNVALNAGLQRYGGDLYVGSMTIMQSVMQMLVMPIQGITQGAQPIMSYNYGAKNYSRVRKTFSLLLKVMLLTTVSGFALAALLPGVLARMFTQDAELTEIVKKTMPIFFGGISAFGAQMACQTTFMALGQAKISLFLALLRKVVLLVPLALLLPVVMGGNVLGIYIAEPVADVIASFTTLSLFLIKRKTLLPDGGAHRKKQITRRLFFERQEAAVKHDSFKTYLHWGLTAFGVVALSILFFFSLFKAGALVHFFQTLLGILMPFVYGLAIAYLLTPVFNWLHARFAPALQKRVKNPRRAARARKISFHGAFRCCWRCCL